MSNVNETLKERGKVYGDYKGGSEFRANVMKLIVDRNAEVNHGGMPAIYMVYLYDIVNKHRKCFILHTNKENIGLKSPCVSICGMI